MKKDKVFGSAVGHLTMEDVNSFPQPDEWNLLPGIRFNYSCTEGLCCGQARSLNRNQHRIDAP